jgi:hypothetical protein
LKRLYIYIFLLCTFGLSAHAQTLGGGVRIGGNYYLAKKDYKVLSYGGFVSYKTNKISSFRLGLMFGLPLIYEQEHQGIAVDAALSPPAIKIRQTTSVFSYSIMVEFNTYLSEPSDQMSGLYFTAGLAYLGSSATTTYDHDFSTYTIPDYTLLQKEKHGQLMLRAGLGFDVNVGQKMKWYIETGIGMPGSTNERRPLNSASLPGYLELATGVKF